MQDDPNPLFGLLVNVKNALDNLVKAVTEYQQSEASHKKEETETELKAVVRLPVEVTKYYESEERERPVTNNREGIRTVLEIAGVSAAIVLAILTVCTLRTLNRQLIEMGRQTCIQRDAAINAERAWVGLDGPPSVDIAMMEHGMGATIGFTIRNYGKGPALSVMADATITPSDPNNQHAVEDGIESTCNLLSPFVGVKPTSPVFFDDSLEKHQWGQVIFPGQPFRPSTIDSMEMSKMVGKEVYITGCIVYRDQFSEPHWTKFCYNTGDFAKDVVRDASSFGHLYMCNANNYTDDAKKKRSCPN